MPYRVLFMWGDTPPEHFQEPREVGVSQLLQVDSLITVPILFLLFTLLVAFVRLALRSLVVVLLFVHSSSCLFLKFTLWRWHMHVHGINLTLIGIPQLVALQLEGRRDEIIFSGKEF
jgi:hypothetical protein